jgi:hypothetical protein
MVEVVYIFSNEAMPNLIKIGKTARDDIQQRLDELYNSHTGVPLPFTCLYKAVVENGDKVEKALHAAFDCDRINPKREFFTTAPHRVIALLKAFALPDYDTAVQEEDVVSSTSPEEMLAVARVARENVRRSNFRFSEMDVPIGAELVYVDDEMKRCTVVDDRKVQYEETLYSLSGLALKLRLEAGYKTVAVNGAGYFLYEGELLSEHRYRMESEEEN